ncbi:uncharacterized protein LOC108742266 [Agrilus planipennis]|uniref:Uncharacterized protein LOC108742266 n=1 Tax=Agrilus planipennis TaxID=224129 RepID=A0A7F5QXT9_AGRPL|nr:uncharacterized protein LOC108742266 [Agrilus planipennis]
MRFNRESSSGGTSTIIISSSPTLGPHFKDIRTHFNRESSTGGTSTIIRSSSPTLGPLQGHKDAFQSRTILWRNINHHYKFITNPWTTSRTSGRVSIEVSFKLLVF